MPSRHRVRPHSVRDPSACPPSNRRRRDSSRTVGLPKSTLGNLGSDIASNRKRTNSGDTRWADFPGGNTVASALHPPLRKLHFSDLLKGMHLLRWAHHARRWHPPKWLLKRYVMLPTVLMHETLPQTNRSRLGLLVFLLLQSVRASWTVDPEPVSAQTSAPVVRDRASG